MPDNNPTTISNIASIEAINFGLEKKYNGFMSMLGKEISNGNRVKAKSSFEILMSIADCQRAINETKEVLLNGKGKTIFACGSWFLQKCLSELAKTEKESLLYITGLKFGSVRTLERFLNLEYANQTTTYVSADKKSNQQALIELGKYGQSLHAWFHSHPGSGAEATMPSTVDLRHQSDLEKGGYSAIGGIFTRDGYVRFFTKEHKYEIEVIGKGIEKVEEGIYKINKI